MAETAREWMDPFLAVFNCHINKAHDQARRRFIKRYSRKAWHKRIAPIQRKGIMSIFSHSLDRFTRFYVYAVTHYVNKGVARPRTEARND